MIAKSMRDGGDVERERKTFVATAGLAAWIALALAAAAAFYWAIASGVFSWAALVEARLALSDLVALRPWATFGAYIAFFVVMSLVLFPAQLWVILIGAILLGFERGFAASWLAACVSAGLVFWLARSAFGGVYRRHAQRYLDRVEAAFQRDQFLYMLMLRFIPVCPYCVANVLPAVLGARFWPFLAATAIGVVPYVGVYSFAGARAAAMLDPERAPDLASISADLIPVLAAFAALPVLAIVVRSVRRRGAPA